MIKRVLSVFLTVVIVLCVVFISIFTMDLLLFGQTKADSFLADCSNTLRDMFDYLSTLPEKFSIIFKNAMPR